ncbi:MAG: Rab family GTPase [Phycisphaerales bacterium]
MISKKVCMVGAFGVGKTSLIARFVSSVFSDKYLSTVGVKVDKKTISVDGKDALLMLWDVAGEDDSTRVNMSYIKGAAGYLLVMDRTRKATLTTATDLKARVDKEAPAIGGGAVPFVAVVNKSDLTDKFEITDADIEALQGAGWTVLSSSAKSGENVEAAFAALARKVLGGAAGGQAGGQAGVQG